MARKSVLDENWAGHAFLAPPSALVDDLNIQRKFTTTSSRKFIDTTLGGHWAINPFSQFTANADIKHKSAFSASKGVGRWWDEKLNDNAQYVHIRCGVPEFNSMTSFFGNFYNVHAGSVARTGRAPDIWYTVGSVAGVIGTLPMQPFILAGNMYDFFMGMPRSKYYYLKETMYPYWYAVSNFVNGIIVNLGISPHFANDEQKQYFNPEGVPDKRDIDSMHRILPDIVNVNGGIDVFAISTKAQRLANEYRLMLDAALSGLSGNPATRDKELNTLMYDGTLRGLSGLRDPGASLAEFQKAYQAFGGKYDAKKASSADEVNMEEGNLKQASKQFQAIRRMGADFVTFRVNPTPSNSESFNNTVTQSSLQSSLNGISSDARMKRFNIADGNIGGPVGAAVKAVTGIATGMLEAAQVEGFIALAGNAFADIQKLYEASSADLNRTSFTIPLRAWAADDWVRLKNLYLPLGAILALGLPRATGRASYDGPFLLEVFNQGHTQIREGMVESIVIERGVGDVGWGKEGKVLGIDVTVNIVDMSSILSMPINPGFSNVQGVFTATAEAVGGIFGQAGADVAVDAVSALSKSTYGEDNKWTDYLATLAGLSLENQINNTRRWKLNMARSRAQFDQWKSPSRITSGLMNNWVGDVIKAVSRPTDRP